LHEALRQAALDRRVFREAVQWLREPSIADARDYVFPLTSAL
jgi:hypothetical protein